MIYQHTAHTSLSVQEFLTQNSMTPVPHPPYSPDLTPCNFFLFPQMKKVLKGKCFADMPEVIKKTADMQKGININKSLDRCVASNGEDFEGDCSSNM